MPPRRREFERIKAVLSEADADGPLTAREILELLDEHDVDIESPHTVATVLGRQADSDDVDVIQDQPYRYRLN
jgi:hypothetical protein